MSQDNMLRCWPVLAALGVTTAPLLLQLPLWIPLLVLVMLGLRGRMLWAGRALPARWLLLCVLTAAVLVLWLTTKTLVGREGGVALLSLLLGFKAFESASRRDWQVLLALGFFLAGMPLLFDQSPLAAAWLTLSLLALTWAMVLLAGAAPKGSLRTAISALLLALPMMLVLFVVMPRLPGPLWSMPHDQKRASTGMSDEMEPGSISQLIQNQEPAFSVVFDGAIPPRPSLYWRMMIFDDFDGRRWQNIRGVTQERMGLSGGDAVNYTLTLRPEKSRLPALEYVEGPSESTRMEPGGVLRLEKEGEELFRYRARSRPQAAYLTDLSLQDQQFYRRLPVGNPQTRLLAERLRLQGGDDAGFVRAALEYFRLGAYRYTLSPPLLDGDEPIDQFLFSTRQGFCEHYASAMAVLARAAGLPARVVVGYQGGEYNPVGRFWQVRSSDAHAWVEVWLPSRQQWLRVDPTAAVAPSRVSEEVTQAIPALAGGGAAGAASANWWRPVRQGWQALSFSWQQWVVGYDASRQQGLYQRLGLGDSVDSAAVTKGVLIGGALACLPLLLLWRRQKGLPPLAEGRARIVGQLARHGIAVRDSDGPLDIINKSRRLPEQEFKQLKRLFKRYSALRYGAAKPDSAQERAWLKEARRFSVTGKHLARGSPPRT